MEHNLGQDYIPASGSIDKSRVLNVKPLRSLVPIFPSPSNPPSQGGAPFVCASPSGPFPSGVTPFYPFFSLSDSQRTAEQNQQTPTGRRGPIATAVPINSFRTPSTANGDVDDTDVEETDRGKKTRSQKKRGRKSNRSVADADVVDVDAAANDILATINPALFNTLGQVEGSKETVAYTLMIFEVLRRKITQIEEARGGNNPGHARRPDLKAGSIMMTKGIRTNSKKHIGLVPGVEIGDIFFFRFELCLVGLHSPSMAGIDFMGVKVSGEEEPLAVSIVSSGGYEDDVEDGDVLIYSGQGAAKDQKLERGNLALEKSVHRGNEVRVIRGMESAEHPMAKIYVYDGLYKIQNSWVEKGKSGFNVFRYKLARLPGQPAAYMIWKSIKQWTDQTTSRVGVILPDLTSGAEKLPVCLVNDVDNEKGPAYFTYYPTLKISKPIGPVEPSSGCGCIGGCQPGNFKCSCIYKNGGYLPYSPNGVLLDLKSVIHECGASCQCPPNCRNRLSSGGLKFRLEVFRTKDRGWGLRSWDPIRAGSFICEYAGEVIDNARVEELGGDNEDDYIFDSTRIYQQLEVFPSETEAPKIPYPLYISAKNVGNVARFMNHSCSPNVFWRPILRENKNESDLHIAFHAVRHIPPMTELTYDYGVVLPLSAGQRKKRCLCGSAKCRGYFF